MSFSLKISQEEINWSNVEKSIQNKTVRTLQHQN